MSTPENSVPGYIFERLGKGPKPVMAAASPGLAREFRILPVPHPSERLVALAGLRWSVALQKIQEYPGDAYATYVAVIQGQSITSWRLLERAISTFEHLLNGGVSDAAADQAINALYPDAK